MRFKCGLTDEEKKRKREVELHKAKCLIEFGEVVFTWWPTKIAPGDCRWLEKVRRYPTSYTSYDFVDSHTYSLTPANVAAGLRDWRYESLDKKET